MRKLFLRFKFLFAAISLISGSGLSSAALSAGESQTYLITISNEQYPGLGKECDLHFAVDDAMEVTRRLRDRSKIVSDERILRFTSATADPVELPTHQNIHSKLPEFLAGPRPDDTIIVFIALQGARIRNSVTGQFEGYLLPADVDPVKMMDSMISLTWLKEQLLLSPARNVVLLLDTSHAGSIGDQLGSGIESISAKEIGNLFNRNSGKSGRDKNLYTVVSCDEDQKSCDWPEMKQSVFAYWLCQGLDGAADGNADSIISMDELFDFIEQEVPVTAELLNSGDSVPFRQTPLRFLLGTNQGNLDLFPMHPEPAGSTLKRLSGLVDALIRNHLHDFESHAVPRISVLEFATVVDTRTLETGKNAELRGALGSLGVVSRDIIERQLIKMTNSRHLKRGYTMVHADALTQSLRNVKLGDVMTTGLTAVAPMTDAIVFGTFTRFGGSLEQPGPDRLLFEVRLLQLQGQENQPPAIIGHMSSTILVDKELWSLLGGAIGERRPDTAIDPAQDEPILFPKAEAFSASTIAPAPATRKRNPASSDNPVEPVKSSVLDIQICQGTPGVERAAVDLAIDGHEGDAYRRFLVRNGNELEFRVSNTTDEWLAMVVMVDGYNVIGKERTLPSEARYWLIPPKGKGVIDQWLTGDPEFSKVPAGTETQRIAGRNFLVVNAPASVARQQGFDADLGEIRILAYKTEEVPDPGISRVKNTKPSIGIGEGRARSNHFPVYRHRRVDFREPPEKHVFHYVEQQL